MRPITLFALLLSLLAILPVGCVSAVPTTHPTNPTSTPIITDAPSRIGTEVAITSKATPPPASIEVTITVEAVPPATSTKVAFPSEAVSLVNQAIDNLTSRFGVLKAEIAVLSVEAVEWSDTSLGCPQHGMVYAQVITPGFQILLQAEKVLYVYHTDEVDRIILCQARPPDDIYPTP